MSDTNLDEMLETTTPEAQPATAEPVDDAGPGETIAEAPPATAAQQPPNGYVPLTVVQDERRKRQEAEREVQEFRRLMQAQPRQQQPTPDWYAEPDKAAEMFQRQVQTQVYQTRVLISQEVMKERHADYDEVEEIFADEVERNPSLKQQLLNHPMPAKFAYETGQRIKLLREIGNDPAAYRQRVIDEWQASQGQSPAPSTRQATPARSPLPTSLASTPSARPRERDERGRFAEPASLDSILGD